MKSNSFGHVCQKVGENNIDVLKMRNNFGMINFSYFCNILISLAPHKAIALNLFCFIIGISSLYLFLIHPVVFAEGDNYCFKGNINKFSYHLKEQ